jgi:hypothetical protein
MPGFDEVVKAMVGSTPATAIYAGTQKVWPLRPSYNDATGGTVTEYDKIIHRTNLAPDPSIEAGVGGWPSPAPSVVEHSAEHAFVGTHSLKYTKNHADGTATASRHSLIPVTPGKRYTLSVSVFGAPGLQASVGIEYRDAAGAAVTGGPTGANERQTTDGVTWQRIVLHSWSLPENVTQVQIRVAHPATNPAGSVLWFDAVVFEEGVTDGSWFDGASMTQNVGRFRVHTFTAGGDFTVTKAAHPFRTLLVGGGGGGRTTQDDDNPGGGGGVVNEVAEVVLTVGAHPVVVGTAGPVGGNGGESSLNGLTAAGGTAGSQYGGGNSGSRTGGAGSSEQAGGGAGAGENGYGGADWLAGDGGNGVQSDITGVLTWYGGGGCGTGIKDCNNRMNEGWAANKMVARRPDRRGDTPLAAMGGLGGGGSIPNVTGPADGVDGLGGGGAGQGRVSAGQVAGRGGKGTVVVSYEIEPPPPPVGPVITGGVVEQDGEWTVHTLSDSGDLVVEQGGEVEYFIVAGGGGGAGRGGGAGGLIPPKTVTLAPGTYPVVIGDGGLGGHGGTGGAGKGQDSTFNGETAIGGGPGGAHTYDATGHGGDGGSGGGAQLGPDGGHGTPGQGHDGGQAGGGGAGGPATFNDQTYATLPGPGLEVWGTPYASGGTQGAADPQYVPVPFPGGGGRGGLGAGLPGSPGVDGTGGGGGGSGFSMSGGGFAAGGKGGKGIFKIRYKA